MRCSIFIVKFYLFITNFIRLDQQQVWCPQYQQILLSFSSYLRFSFIVPLHQDLKHSNRDVSILYLWHQHTVQSYLYKHFQPVMKFLLIYLARCWPFHPIFWSIWVNTPCTYCNQFCVGEALRWQFFQESSAVTHPKFDFWTKSLYITFQSTYAWFQEGFLDQQENYRYFQW